MPPRSGTGPSGVKAGRIRLSPLFAVASIHYHFVRGRAFTPFGWTMEFSQVQEEQARTGPVGAQDICRSR